MSIIEYQEIVENATIIIAGNMFKDMKNVVFKLDDAIKLIKNLAVKFADEIILKEQNDISIKLNWQDEIENFTKKELLDLNKN